MDIEYTYEIVKVDAAARCMEVVYSAVGHPTMHIGTRIPVEGESLEDVIKSYAPVPLWLDLIAVLSPPAVGTKGVIVPEPIVEPTPEESIPTTTV